MSETITGKLGRIRYHGVGKGSRSGIPFLIAELLDGKIVKGEMASPRYDEIYRFVGENRVQKRYNEVAFEFEFFEEIVDSIPGVAQYLKKNIPGLGPKKAAAIAESLGADCLRILQSDPDEARKARGVNADHVEAIRKWFAENKRVDPIAVVKLLDMFSGHRFPKKLAEQLALDFGSDAPEIVKTKPYILLSYPRMGWATVDPFALAQGYDKRGLDRHRAAIVEAFEQINDKAGHTYATVDDVEAIGYGLIGERPSLPAWVAAIHEGDIVSHGLNSRRDSFVSPDDDTNGTRDSVKDCRIQQILSEPQSDTDRQFSLPRIALAEGYIAGKLAQLTASGRPVPFSASTEGLNEDQQAAIQLFHDHSVCMLLGAPGTGKTYTISRFVRSAIEAGYRKIRVVAPTGKAAKRAEELITQSIGDMDATVPCTTIHRALAPTPSDAPLGVPESAAKIGRGREQFTFGKNESDPLDVDLLIADETSMQDVKLCRSLLEAISPGTRIIFVGDCNQLPSVGPGSVLRDMKDSGCIPFVELTRIVRSDGGGRVVRACHAIKDGGIPQPAEGLDLPTENWIHVERNDPRDIAEAIVQVYRSIRDNGNYDPYEETQVVSAQKELPSIGCRDLNSCLSDLLNPIPEGQQPEDPNGFAPEFRVGDKVVRRKNGVVGLISEYNPEECEGVDWRWNGKPWSISEVEVVNGDLGRVEDIVVGEKHSYVVVRFRNPDRLCRLPRGDAHIQAAFAVTVHTAQGSGFPVVIVPVHLSYHWHNQSGTGLFSRELVYTAISRAEKILITVGQFAAIEAIVRRKTVDFRKTRLVVLLKRSFEDVPELIRENEWWEQNEEGEGEGDATHSKEATESLDW